jgi:gluconate kinase
MNPALLESQLKTLEPPAEGEAYRVVNDRPPDVVVDEILAHVAVGRT